MHFMAYRKFYWLIFPETFIFEVPSLKKLKIGHRTKFRAKKNFFSADFIPSSRGLAQHLTSSVLILIHSTDMCILVIACVDCVRSCSKKPSPAFVMLF